MILQFIGFFLAGLAVNLTPCVYPMLTVTSALFKPKEGEKVKHSFIKALIYVSGISLMYSSLGYVAASTGKIFGAALQNSWVLGTVAVMMFALGLSMLGLFQFAVPGQLLTKLNKFRKLNYIGLFFSGMLVGIFAAPCIGPPVLALLAAVANNGDPKFGFLAFLVFSLGMGLPYLLLGTFSSLITKLPKAGGWLIWVEKIFGVILLGFGIFYLALAMHWHLPQGEQKNIWQPYNQQKLEQAVKEHQPVVIDFFAEWCFGCHELDQNVFSKPEVQAKLAQVTALRVDATNMDDPLIQEVLDQYSLIGLPTIVFLDRSGQEIKEFRIEGSGSLDEFNASMQGWAEQVNIIFKENK
jgi:thiol:disulfide interchange protein DsbD